jgi:non-homologous end joining protein Ku
MVHATSIRERIRFNIINRETGNRIHHRGVDAETGEEVPEEERVKGYKIADGSYVLLKPGELDQVALESTHIVDIDYAGTEEPIASGAQDRRQKQAPQTSKLMETR